MITHRCALRTLSRLRLPEVFQPNRLLGRWKSKKIPKWARPMFTSAGMEFVAQGSHARSERGLFQKTQFVLYQTALEPPGGAIPWAAAVIAGYETTVGAVSHVVATVHTHDMLPDVPALNSDMKRFRKSRRTLVNLLSFRCSLARAVDGQYLRVVFPMDLYVFLK